MSANSAAYRFSVEKYEKLGEIGILSEDDRVELLDGEIIVMEPIKPLHAGAVMRLNFIFQGRLRGKMLLSAQNPAVLDEFSEPQPDIMLLQPKADFYQWAHPRPEDILVLVEVSDTTLVYDRGRKLRKYAECGVSEVWIVNLKNMMIEQFREPAAAAYSFARTYGRGERITAGAFPEVTFQVEELIG